MFRPYIWAIFRLRSNFSGTAIQDVWGVFWVLWVGWAGEISFLSIVGTMTWGITSGLSLGFFVHVTKWVSILMCTKKTNDNPLVKPPGHGTHYWNKRDLVPSPPPPNPQYPKNTPHILYSGPWKVRSQPEDGPYIGPKHVVLFLLYY